MCQVPYQVTQDDSYSDESAPYLCFQSTSIPRHPKAITETKKPEVAQTTELRVTIISPEGAILPIRGLLDTGSSKSIILNHDTHKSQIQEKAAK